jgi:iron complex transport system substrate-binding protein
MDRMRIVSLISAGTEMLYALGLGEHVVAVSHECDWPPECRRLPRVTRSNIDPAAESGAIDRQVRELMQAGKPLYQIDAAQIADLRPDLIVTQAQCDVCAVAYDDVISAVRSHLVLKNTRVMSLNPQSLPDVFEEMLQIGTAAGESHGASIVVDRLRQRVERIRAATATLSIAERPRVAIIEWTDPLMLAGNWVPKLVEIAGGRCELTPPGQHSHVFTWQGLQQFDPEVIVVCPCGFDLFRAEAELKRIAKQPEWNDLSAVKNGRVHAVDGNAYFNRPGPRLVESVELLSQLLHPNKCAFDNRR